MKLNQAETPHVNKVCTVVFTIFATVVGSIVEASSEAICSVNGLPREGSGDYRLAVKLDDGWTYVMPQTQEILDIRRREHNRLCLAWEAPPYTGTERQIVYISSRYMHEQPVRLWRNHSVDPIIKTPFRGRLPRRSAEELFQDFHNTAEPEEIRGGQWSVLEDWHNTHLWLANLTSFELVSTAVDVLDKLPRGTERLLRLRSRRPLPSWVPFTTLPPDPDTELHIAVLYSGDVRREPELPVYWYVSIVKK